MYQIIYIEKKFDYKMMLLRWIFSVVYYELKLIKVYCKLGKMKEERKITVISLEKIDSLDEIKYSLDDAIKLTGKKSLEECVLKILNFDKKRLSFMNIWFW